MSQQLRPGSKRKRHRKSLSLAKKVQRFELKQLVPLLRGNRRLGILITWLLFLLGIAFTYHFIAPRILGE